MKKILIILLILTLCSITQGACAQIQKRECVITHFDSETSRFSQTPLFSLERGKYNDFGLVPNGRGDKFDVSSFYFLDMNRLETICNFEKQNIEIEEIYSDYYLIELLELGRDCIEESILSNGFLSIVICSTLKPFAG